VTEKVPQEISESFKLLASAYADELSFPAYSRPLSADDTHLLQPNQYIPQQVPLQGDASAAIVLPKFRFSYPDTVEVMLQVTGLAVSDVKVQLTSESSAELLVSDEMQGVDGNWSASLSPEDNWDGPLQVVVSFNANGKQQQLKTGIEYSQPVATITGIQPSVGAGSDMIIPVQIDVKQAGYYRLRANLFTEQRQPLALLSQSEKLSSGRNEIKLRAYKGVLQAQSGPFILSTFVLEKRPAQPGELTRYGDSEQPEYTLEYFALGQLSDEPWQPNAEELQRLEFLQQMSSGQ